MWDDIIAANTQLTRTTISDLICSDMTTYIIRGFDDSNVYGKNEQDKQTQNKET